MQSVTLSWNKCKHLIQNSDILLFRSPSFPSVGFLISLYTFSTYSHAALACVEDNAKVNCIEFREFIGSRVKPLEEYINEGEIVDVFRAPFEIKVPYIYAPPSVSSNGTLPILRYKVLYFNNSVQHHIVNEAKTFLGQQYGWRNIWNIASSFVPLIRHCINKNSLESRPKNLVCSTLVSYCFRKHFVDLTPAVNDLYVTPGDLGNSSILQHLFTINEL